MHIDVLSIPQSGGKQFMTRYIFPVGSSYLLSYTGKRKIEHPPAVDYTVPIKECRSIFRTSANTKSLR